MGMNRNGNCIYITDLGLSTEYRPQRAHSNAPSNPRLLGTARFASVNGHLGVGKLFNLSSLAPNTTDHRLEQSRRDDMESLGYMLIYFLNGRLPWQGLKVTPEQQRNALIMEKKRSINVEELCEKQPPEFAAYIEHINSLAFGDTPDYSYLRKKFRNLFVRCGFKHDNVFDWTVKRYMEQRTV